MSTERAPVPASPLSDVWSRRSDNSYEENSLFLDNPCGNSGKVNIPTTKLYLVLAHGLFGSSNDFERLRQFSVEKFPDALVVSNA